MGVLPSEVLFLHFFTLRSMGQSKVAESCNF